MLRLIGSVAGLIVQTAAAISGNNTVRDNANIDL
jgi:hypothetical protein